MLACLVQQKESDSHRYCLLFRVSPPTPFYAVWRQIAGWVGLWVGLVAFYAATAILTAEVWEREWLPIGHMLKRPAAKKTCAAAP